MRIGERKYGAATCQLGFVPGVPDHMKHETRFVSCLEVESALRGKGHATELMNRLAEEADKKKVILILNPGAPEGGPMTTSQLVEWYGRMGYQEIQRSPLLMVRMFAMPQIAEEAKEVTNMILENAR